MKTPSVFAVSIHVLLRQRLFLLALFAISAALLSAGLAAEFGARQPATLALDVGLSVIKLVLPLFMVFQVQELFSREFERKFYQLSLTYPISRFTWLMGRFLALVLVSGTLLVLISGLLSLQVFVIGQEWAQPTPVSLGVPFWTTIFFVAVDLFVLLCMACFWAVIASTPSFVLIGTLGFMLTARSYSTVLALLAADTGAVENAETYRTNLGILGYVLPDLGALDVRAVTLYGQMDLLPADWPMFTASCLLYALGFVSLAAWLFRRKQFA